MNPASPTAPQVPVHVAIIMDGNGRWAKAHGLPRNAGHRQGVQNVKEIVRASADLGIRFLTLYAFSAENWSRPKEEVDELMKLLERFLDSQAREIKKQRLRLLSIGDISALPASVQERLAKVCAESDANDRGTLVLALNYGSRQEIVTAATAYAQAAKEGRENPASLDWATLSKYLYTRDIPDPDLIIRTSGEQRVSNFLLLQGAYAEYYFCEKNWPEFGPDDLKAALAEFAKRERRFGMTSEQIQTAKRDAKKDKPQ
jgi:undecaprenyl diphosphate synthase